MVGMLHDSRLLNLPGTAAFHSGQCAGRELKRLCARSTCTTTVSQAGVSRRSADFGKSFRRVELNRLTPHR
jgi:hypothetical protein